MGELFRRNHLIWTVSAFLMMFAIFLYIKPSIAFGPNGSIKPFGVQREGRPCFLFGGGLYCLQPCPG